MRRIKKSAVVLPVVFLLAQMLFSQGAVAQGQTLTLFGKWTISCSPASVNVPCAANGICPSSETCTETPVSPTLPGDVQQLVTTNTNTYILSGGTVYAMGSTVGGGSGWTPQALQTPTKMTFGSGVPIASLAPVGPNGTEMAIDMNGNVWGWGLNSFGQLCVSGQDVLTPVELGFVDATTGLVTPFTNVTAVAGAGDHASYYVKNPATGTNTLYSCGGNGNGDLGDGNTKPSVTPVAVTGLPNKPITALTAGWGTEGALLQNGALWVWGYNANGELGDNSNTPYSDVPVKVALDGVTQAAQGGGGPSDGTDVGEGGQTVTFLSDGATEAWGNDNCGQTPMTTTGCGQLCLGKAKATFANPKTVPQPDVNAPWTQAASGGDTVYLVDSAGNLWACGDNVQGQFGIPNGPYGNATGTPVGTSSPQQLPYTSVDQISSTNYNSAVLTG